MTTVVPRRQLYLTALSILLVVLLLLVFISVSTYRNLNRERDAAMETVRRQALTLINALEAGARAGMMMQMAGKDAIGNLVHEIGRSEDINYLYLVNAAGEVIHHSIPSLEGTRALWRPVFERPGVVHTRVRRLADGTRVYEVAKPFTPMDIHAQVMTTSPVHFHTRATVYLGMSLTAYERARQSDLQHALIMAGIVLTLGSGVIYFFIVIRSYYLLSKTLQEARDYTRQVIASMAHGVLSVDTDGKVVSFNQRSLALLGVPATDMEGLDLHAVFDFEATGIARTLDRGLAIPNHEIEFGQSSADAKPLSLTVTPIRDEAEGRNGAVVVVRDLSTIKKLEEKVRRAEKMAALGRLAAGVAHEIRNPLSSIRGFAYLLGRGHAEDTAQREYADVMVREIDRINHVVSDLLEFARPMKLEPEATTIGDLIEHVIALVSADATKAGIQIRIEGETDLPPVALDPNQITQALLNLMLNAIHALAEGGIIRVSATADHEPDGVSIRVQDDGPGIAPELQEKIFEPFFTTGERGTGLGLAMVRKIAENHDGRIGLRSPPPGATTGTRFSLVLRDMAAGSDPGSRQAEMPV